jgi:RNA polymerase sigma factor (sigma-70 family)
VTSAGQASSGTDAEAVRAVLGGDKAAFAVLVSRHERVALCLVSRLLGAGPLVEDALQEATVAALVGIEQLRSPERFGARYAGIALNVARRMLRERRRLAADSLPTAGSVAGVDEQVEAAELARLVRRAVEGLAAGQRAAVLAFYWRGLTHAEAAAELSISVGAVKARLHAARVALAPELRSTIEDEEVVAMPSGDESRPVAVEVVEVRRSADQQGSERYAVVLAEQGGDRRLAIWVGRAEALALACSLESYETPRPMTYQFAAGLLKASGSTVSEVRITRLADATYYAPCGH